jgi:dTMP kinase
VLSYPSFRRLWTALSLSSLGDWLSILALTALAAALTSGSGFRDQCYAVGGVLLLRMLPAVLLPPLGGAIADRFDRRLAMAVADLLRFALIVSVPVVHKLGWLLAVTFLVECAALLWTPAKDATIPHLVPKDKIERAGQVSRATTYGTAPIAALLFSVIALISGASFAKGKQADLALYVDAVAFLISAATVFTLADMPGRVPGAARVRSVFAELRQGRRLAADARLIRGLVFGLIGAFAAGGAVIGGASGYVRAMGGGDAGYGAVFAGLFLGLAFGMFLGPRMLRDLSRRRLFGLAVGWAALALAAVALIPNLVVVVFVSAFLGIGAGAAWATARVLLGQESEEEQQDAVFGFLQSLGRLVLLVVLAAVPFLAGVLGTYKASAKYHFGGTNAVLLGAAVLALLVAFVAYRLIDDRRGIPLPRDLAGALRGVPYEPESAEPSTRAGRGLFIAFEGGDGAGKTTQSRLTSIWLRDQGYEVVTTNEPGATKIGMRLRAILLDRETAGLADRAEALLYAADRADHVDAVIAPALRRGTIVVSDRYIDSSLAYQGYGRNLDLTGLTDVNRWATGDLLPDLTVVLDVPAEVGTARLTAPADRMESESRDFHERVRKGFRALAAASPERYLVLDASRPQVELTRAIQDRIREILPDPVPAGTEDITSTFPAIRD